MWRKVLSWEVKKDFQIGDDVSIDPRGFPTTFVQSKFPENKGTIWDIDSQDPDVFYVHGETGGAAYINSKYMTLVHRPEKRKKSSLQKTSIQLTAENITNKQIEPGDFISPDQTFKDNTNRVIFTQGKEYPVLEYSNFTLGLLVHSDVGPWTITFKENGIGSHFSWRKPTREEQKQTILENNPFITDILNIVSTSGSYPMTVEQVTDKVQQLYTSEGGKMSPKEFQTQITAAWGDAFHLGLVAMVRRSDKVAITPEGRQYLQG
jgi:hypothetical protein